MPSEVFQLSARPTDEYLGKVHDACAASRVYEKQMSDREEGALDGATRL